MGYWFRAGSRISGYNAHATVNTYGSGALHGWFGTARLDCYLTLRVFNFSSYRTWTHTDHVRGGSVWFGVVVGAGFQSPYKRVSTFCDAEKSDWLYLDMGIDVDATVNALGHASVAMTGEVLDLQLCS